MYSGDESGFCLPSPIPYGWQFPGEHVTTRPRHSPRLNVLGFYNTAANNLFTNDLGTNACEGPMNAAFVVEAIDAWAAARIRPTVLVLDNASIHHATPFRARLQAWKDQDVHIFHLPAYSPHFNKIETLWRKTKYEWLRPEAYADFQTLKTAVWYILDRVGHQFNSRFAP